MSTTWYSGSSNNNFLRLAMALLRDTTSSQKMIIYSNAIIRLAQFTVAVVALGVYAQQFNYWVTHGMREWAMVGY